MSDSPDTLFEAIANGIKRLEADNAPAIFVDNVISYGHNSGVVYATVAAGKPSGDGTIAVPVAHLRMTVEAARLLAENITQTIAMIERDATSAALN